MRNLGKRVGKKGVHCASLQSGQTLSLHLVPISRQRVILDL